MGKLLVTALACALASGCASLPYEPSRCAETEAMPLRANERQIERGNPHAFLDGFGSWVLGLPSKLTLLSTKVDNHDVSPETEAALSRYIEANGLCDVKVRINQYSVPGEWSRLVRNRNISGFWRYTFGVISLVQYTIFPQRAFGGDNYNPFTNTIHLYSDLESVALHEGGHAKDFAGRSWKGAYAAAGLLPLVPLIQERTASKDAVSYLRANGEIASEKAAYPLLWSAYSTYIGGEALQWYSGPEGWVGLLTLPLAWTGKLAGYVKARSVDEVPAAPPDATPNPVDPEVESMLP
jgi:hypothetical protein